MDATPMSYSQTPSLTKTGVLASPPELLHSLDRFPSPTPSNTNRCLYTTPMSGVQHSSSIDKMSIAAATNPAPHTMLSPPPSPARRLASPSISVSSPPSTEITDRVLFSHSEPAISLETPLFDVSEQFEPLIQNVISSKTKRKSDSRPKPTDEEYNAFVSCAWRLCQSNPRDWLRREKANMKIIDRAGSRIQKPTVLAGYTPKRNIAPARSVNNGAPSALKPRTAQGRSARTPRPTPKAIVNDSFAYPDGRLPTPQTPSSAAVRARAVATREDADFEAIPDMSPPLETLPASKCLKADWKGTVLDLSDDPHAGLLHPAELHLASVLRLSCASYLTSKRRIFQMKVERERMGLKFMKTDSQKACKIDVNKASKLWTAYEKVGWFDRRYIQQYL